MESGERRTENEDRKAENYELSERETDVLVLVAKGLSSKEIADKLNISVHTVNSHRKNITHKTGIKSVAGLAVYAMIHNLM
ncbi:MAG: helix-turn-helix transcriptional regulator [Bacteroidales bacterium]|nr:helix-turn-helix transcriptional regulator [Bacteroidales bacterium]